MTSTHVYIRKQAHNIIDEKTVHTIHTCTHKTKTYNLDIMKSEQAIWWHLLKPYLMFGSIKSSPHCLRFMASGGLDLAVKRW